MTLQLNLQVVREMPVGVTADLALCAVCHSPGDAHCRVCIPVLGLWPRSLCSEDQLTVADRGANAGFACVVSQKHTPKPLSACPQDHTGQQWLTSFEESGVKIMGKSAHELKQLENTPEFERTNLVPRHACPQGCFCA